VRIEADFRIFSGTLLLSQAKPIRSILRAILMIARLRLRAIVSPLSRPLNRLAV
jgi:hypothetical protein